MSIANDLKNKHYAITHQDYEPIERRQGVVVSFDGPSRTCEVFLAGDVDRPVPGIRFLSSYFPKSGDTVWVDIKGVDMMIVGSTTNDEWLSYTSVLTGMSPGNSGSIYYRIGRNCTIDFNFQWTGTSGTGTVFTCTAPFVAHNTMYRYVGSTHMIDQSTGEHKAGICFIENSTNVINFVGTTGIVSGNFGYGSQLMAFGDILTATLTYQVAPGQ